jgi:hypothetical protein
MARRTIVALAAAFGLALIVLPAPLAQAQKAPPGGTTSTAAAGTTSTAAAGGTGTAPAGSPSGSTTPAAGSKTVPAPAAPTPAPAAKPAGGSPAPSTPASASDSEAGTPLPIILLAVLGGLLLLIGLFVLLARFMGWGFERWQPTLHTWREAGYRTENAISEFADWTRLGR